MTIHHDKLLYGKLASLQSDISDADLRAMAEALENCGYDEEADTEQKEEFADDLAGTGEKGVRNDGGARRAKTGGREKIHEKAIKILANAGGV